MFVSFVFVFYFLFGAAQGVYLQFESNMLEEEGIAVLQTLKKTKTVGVWGYAKKDPDDVKTAERLMDIGVDFVNTDLPKGFNQVQ